MYTVCYSKVKLKGIAGNQASMVDAARERLGQAILASWEQRDVEEFIRLMAKFANAMSFNAASSR